MTKQTLSLMVAMMGLCLIPALAADTKPERPNVILIVSDDQGYGDVGFNGGTEVPTPNIDRIAEAGTVFSNGYVSYPVCGPSRAGLVTGRYQDRFGFGLNPTINPEVLTAGLPVEEDQISELLKKVGYTNMVIGKWHLGHHIPFHPLNQGYDEFFGFLSGGHRYFPEEYIYESIADVTTPWGWYQTRLLHNYERVDIDQYLTDELSDRAVEFVSRSRSEPFFLYLAYNAPHAPMQATEEYLERFKHIENEKRRTYAAMVSAMDDGIGDLLDALLMQGLDDDTLVIFLSDNGGATSANAADNGRLRGEKATLFEGGVRVPFAIRWPGHVPSGLTYNEPVISLDILATVAAITGIRVNPDRPLDGVNLLPYLSGEIKGRPHDQLYWRMFDKNRFAIRQVNMKLKVDSIAETTQIFDLNKDESETTNLLEPVSLARDELEAAYRKWESEMIDPVFPGLGSWKLER